MQRLYVYNIHIYIGTHTHTPNASAYLVRVSIYTCQPYLFVYSCLYICMYVGMCVCIYAASLPIIDTSQSNCPMFIHQHRHSHVTIKNIMIATINNVPRPLPPFRRFLHHCYENQPTLGRVNLNHQHGHHSGEPLRQVCFLYFRQLPAVS